MDETQLRRLDASLSPNRWGQLWIKSWLSKLRIVRDFSLDCHYNSLCEFLQQYSGNHERLALLTDSKYASSMLARWRSFWSPGHQDHNKDSACLSMLCSLNEELAISTQQLELKDHQHGLPPGTSVSRAITLTKLRSAITQVCAGIEGVEKIEVRNPHLSALFEFEHFNLNISQPKL